MTPSVVVRSTTRPTSSLNMVSHERDLLLSHPPRDIGYELLEPCARDDTIVAGIARLGIAW